MARPRSIADADILRVAREVFIEGGAFGSTREIAQRLGISEATLFNRYPTKAALFMAAMAPPEADVEAVLASARAQRTARAGLRALTRGVLTYFRAAIPRMLPLITHPAIGIEDLLTRFGESPATALATATATWLAEQHTRGHMRVTDPRASASLLIAALHSVVLFELMGVHGGRLPERAVQAMLDALWSGLAAPASAKAAANKKAVTSKSPARRIQPRS